jgi:ribose transport system ATP-binding protein
MTIATGGLVASGISKSFYGNRVLNNLELEIPSGSVHALLGHNGSGKSTFIKILAGYYTPDDDSGAIVVDGKELEPGDPDSTRDAGITFVHQTLGLVPTLSVLENLRLGQQWETNGAGKISWGKERKLARAALQDFGLDVSPDAIVGNLNTVAQTEVAIVRALDGGDDIRLLVLDEPTAALTDFEVRKLFSTLAHVKARGVAILYVTHRLEEIELIADQVTILRDGNTVGNGSVSEFPWERLVQLITGMDQAALNAQSADPAAGVEEVAARVEAPEAGTGQGALLTISGLRAGEMLDANIEGKAGEIVGAVGLLGSGVIDLARTLTGRLKRESGQVVLDGKPVDVGDFASLARRGLGAVVGERADRVAMGLSVEENVTLGILHRFFKGGLLRRRAVAKSARNAIAEYEVRCAGPDVQMASLSGGNQQKAAIAKVLEADPKVLVLEEPCHGVDERGRREIRAMLRKAAADGALVLVIDSDLDEVVGLCSRVVVFRAGRIAGEFRKGQMSRSRLLDACYGSTKDE